MKITSWLLAATTGAVVAAGLILACSDDSPPHADAATCDCPAAEAPIAGRVMLVTATTPVSATSSAVGGAACPAGATLLTGGCGQDGTDIDNMLVYKSQPMDDGSERWACGWHNERATEVTGKAYARCLMPAQ